jgi:hypothetical protein
MTLDNVLVATTAIDCAAVLALGWLFVRGRRERELAAAEQEAALGRLRAELGDLVAEAERRAKSLDAALAAREQSLRALLAEVGRVEGRVARTASTPRPAAVGVDPAEARLIRDLEVSFARAADASTGRQDVPGRQERTAASASRDAGAARARTASGLLGERGGA